MTSEAVEIWFKIEKDAEGYPESQDWEELWGTPVEGGSFRLNSTPFFVKDIAAGDVVSAVKTEEACIASRKLSPEAATATFGFG